MLKVTYHKSTKQRKSKLNGLNSINTSVLSNQFCSKMRTDKNSICSSCYAAKQEKQYKNVKLRYLDHLQILDESILTNREVLSLKFDSKYIRFHSFGELASLNHLLNLYKICYLNRRKNFTLWTKRIDIISQLNFKPSNLRLIYSNPIIDKKVPVPFLKHLKSLNFTGVFNVWNKKTALNQGTNINCHKNCNDCLLCYKDYNKGIMQVNEIIK